MDTKNYNLGLRREAASMLKRGYTPNQICIALGVTIGFVEASRVEIPHLGGPREWEPDYSHSNETGGY